MSYEPRVREKKIYKIPLFHETFNMRQVCEKYKMFFL